MNRESQTVVELRLLPLCPICQDVKAVSEQEMGQGQALEVLAGLRNSNDAKEI